MSKHVHVELDQDERSELEQLIHSGNAPARMQTRARILLLSDRSQGQRRTDEQVAEAALCSPSTVFSIRHRYIAGGLALALNDKGWPGAKPKLTGELEAQLTMLACSEPPAGQARWTLRLLANQLVELGYIDEVSHVTVREWLKKRTQALASEVLVHRQAVRRVCRQDGRRAGRLRAALRCHAARRLPG